MLVATYFEGLGMEWNLGGCANHDLSNIGFPTSTRHLLYMCCLSHDLFGELDNDNISKKRPIYLLCAPQSDETFK